VLLRHIVRLRSIVLLWRHVIRLRCSALLRGCIVGLRRCALLRWSRTVLGWRSRIMLRRRSVVRRRRWGRLVLLACEHRRYTRHCDSKHQDQPTAAWRKPLPSRERMRTLADFGSRVRNVPIAIHFRDLPSRATPVRERQCRIPVRPVLIGRGIVVILVQRIELLKYLLILIERLKITHCRGGLLLRLFVSY